MTNNLHIGSSLDDFLEEDGILAEVSAIALKRVLAWQILNVMQEKGLSKSQMAACMNTSRSSLDRLLDPDNTSVTLKTLDRAAAILGKRLRIELVDIQNPEAEAAQQSA
jgi:antitoxin HicB